MPADLSGYPHWQKLVESNPAYRQAWLEDRFPPPSGKFKIARVRTYRGGPGTELKRLLAKLGIRATGGCGCNGRARQMDKMGAEWCRERVDTIAGWMVEEGKKRFRVRFPLAMARLLVKLAISRAEKRAGCVEPSSQKRTKAIA